MERISYARLLVEMDVTKELPRKVNMLDINRHMVEQIVQYEWEPLYCAKYCQVGHRCAEQAQPKLQGVQQKKRNMPPKQVWQHKKDQQNDSQVQKSEMQQVQKTMPVHQQGVAATSTEVPTGTRQSLKHPSSIRRNTSGNQVNTVRSNTNGF